MISRYCHKLRWSPASFAWQPTCGNLREEEALNETEKQHRERTRKEPEKSVAIRKTAKNLFDRPMVRRRVLFEVEQLGKQKSAFVFCPALLRHFASFSSTSFAFRVLAKCSSVPFQEESSFRKANKKVGLFCAFHQSLQFHTLPGLRIGNFFDYFLSGHQH